MQAFETRRDFSEAFPFLTPVQERRLKRHLDATAMGFGGFGIWGENRRKHGPGGPDDPPPALDLPAYISEIEGEKQNSRKLFDILWRSWLTLGCDSFMVKVSVIFPRHCTGGSLHQRYLRFKI